MTSPQAPEEAASALSEAAADAFQSALEAIESGAVRSATAALRRLKAELLQAGADLVALLDSALSKPDELMDRDQVAEAVREARNLAYRRGASTLQATGYTGFLPQMLEGREDIHDDLVDTAQVGLKRARVLADTDPEAAVGVVGATEGRVGGRLAAEINRASSDEQIALAERTGAAILWQSERNACVYCLERAGSFRGPDGLFPLGPNGAYAVKPLTWGMPLGSPPRHPHCRCTVVVGARDGLEGLAEAFAREAARSILQADKMPSESESVRLGAAKALLDRGAAGLPRSVQKRAYEDLVSRGAITTARKRRTLRTKPRPIDPTRAPAGPVESAEIRELREEIRKAQAAVDENSTPFRRGKLKALQNRLKDLLETAQAVDEGPEAAKARKGLTDALEAGASEAELNRRREELRKAAELDEKPLGTRDNPREFGLSEAEARRLAEEQVRKVVGPDVPVDALEPVIKANLPGLLGDHEKDWTDKHGIQDLREGEYAFSDHWDFQYRALHSADYDVSTGSMVATRRNGRLFVAEKSPFETQEQAMARLDQWADKINADMAGLPDYQQQAARGVALVLGEVRLPSGGIANADAYDISRGLRFFAGGSRYNRGTLVHENGHLAQFTRFKTKDEPIADSLSWADAIRLDQPLSARYRTELGENPTVGGEFTEPGKSSGHPLMLGGDGVSNYGATDWQEDVAEAFRLWEVQRQFGYVLEETSTGKRWTFEQLFPTRARLMRELAAHDHTH